MATAVQRLLYMLLLALPLTAVAGAWLEGRPLTLVAGVEIPPLLGDFRAGRLASIAPYHSPGNWVLTTLLKSAEFSHSFRCCCASPWRS